MPELPEVQTTTMGLSKVLPKLTITDVWSDLPRMKVTRKDFVGTIKYLPYFNEFKKKVVGQKFISAERRAKNILINISGGNTILVHLKMTGHLMIGKYKYDKKENSWSPDESEENLALSDSYNKFIHVVFSLSNGKHLVFCDSRKFGTVKMIETSDVHTKSHISKLGPEPLEKSFTFEKFIETLSVKQKGKIKQVLMDQAVIAGIGNIYSDEMLWLSGIHPLSVVSKIPKPQMKQLYVAMGEVLKKGIDFGGDSTSDYRNIEGKKGAFHHHHNVYRKKDEKCGKRGCSGNITRIVASGRSAHFCPKHQKVYN
ncbi:bifunctional DNA-formamidopyrimidine glycosylase/DNA-(apurinic or apyrimidinic site) lyase [Candidatus Nomurabacteria bacterium]|nr:MAG: bifunctional DNA-formamidopyrimidine glycosylase/DNA-(apurinic or apyrimidinic site) lyase [Candidatus Nomurabacteria bacterium]